jgi:hypothetical protein
VSEYRVSDKVWSHRRHFAVSDFFVIGPSLSSLVTLKLAICLSCYLLCLFSRPIVLREQLFYSLIMVL